MMAFHTHWIKPMCNTKIKKYFLWLFINVIVDETINIISSIILRIKGKLLLI